MVYTMCLMYWWICPHGLNRVSSCFKTCVLMVYDICVGKQQAVINVIHACMQAGTYRFREPEVTFGKALSILRGLGMHVSSWVFACVLMFKCMCPDCWRMCPHGSMNVSSWFETHVIIHKNVYTEHPASLAWLTDKGKNNVDDVKLYRDFQDALEDGLRKAALSGSRLFKKGAILTKKRWQRVDQWRKISAVLFLLRYVMFLLCVSPHGLMRVSSWLDACVLMAGCMCPHGSIRVSSCHHACPLMSSCLCPYENLHVSSCFEQVFPQISELQIFLQLWVRRLPSTESCLQNIHHPLPPNDAR